MWRCFAVVLWRFVFNCLHDGLLRLDFQTLAPLSDEISRVGDKVGVKSHFILTSFRHLKTDNDPAPSSSSMQQRVVTSKITLPPDKQTQSSHCLDALKLQPVLLNSVKISAYCTVQEVWSRFMLIPKLLLAYAYPKLIYTGGIKELCLVGTNLLT